MEALMRFRCWTLTLQSCNVKPSRHLNLGNVFCRGKKFPELHSQIPDFEKLFEKCSAISEAELAFKKSLFDEFFLECDLKNSILKSKTFSLVPFPLLQEKNLDLSLNDITDKLLSHLDPFPFDKNELWNAPIAKINLAFIRNTIERQYLAWKYQVNIKEIKNILRRLRFCLYLNRSLTNLKKNISLIEAVPEIQKRSVAEKIYHINQKPFDLNSILTFQDKVAGLAWHVFPQHCPKLLRFSHQKILFFVSILQALKFTEIQIQEGLPYFSDYLYFILKLNNLLENPELKKFRNEPEFLQLLSLTDKELHLIISNKTNFKEVVQLIRITKSTCQKRRTNQNSILYLFSQFYEIDKCLLNQDILKKGKFTPEIQIYETLSFLKEMGFTVKEVEESLPIVFYPRHVIASTVDRIRKDENLKKIGFKDDCVSETSLFTKGTKEKRKLLQLCLYYAENPLNIVGSSMCCWSKQNMSSTSQDTSFGEKTNVNFI